MMITRILSERATRPGHRHECGARKIVRRVCVPRSAGASRRRVRWPLGRQSRSGTTDPESRRSRHSRRRWPKKQDSHQRMEQVTRPDDVAHRIEPRQLFRQCIHEGEHRHCSHHQQHAAQGPPVLQLTHRDGSLCAKAADFISIVRPGARSSPRSSLSFRVAPCATT